MSSPKSTRRTFGRIGLRFLRLLKLSRAAIIHLALAMDFEKLKILGFRHVKVRAETLIGGMAHAQAAVAAEDLKSLLQRHGLNLIAERVETEKTVVQLLDYSVDFAQGYLFGEPKPLREDSLKTLDRPEPSAPVIPFRRAG